jgi:hypothetical protein
MWFHQTSTSFLMMRTRHIDTLVLSTANKNVDAFTVCCTAELFARGIFNISQSRLLPEEGMMWAQKDRVLPTIHAPNK